MCPAAAGVRSVISDFHNEGAYDGLLKEVYLPALNDITFNDTSFSALIESASAESLDYKGQRITHTFKTQRAGGVGAIPEGGTFVKSVGMRGKQFHEDIKYLNCYFEITGPAISAVERGEASFVDSVADSISDMMTNCKNDFERQLVGTGNGACAKVATHNDSALGSLTVTGDGYFPSQFLRQGQRITFRHADANLTDAVTGDQKVFIVEEIDRNSDSLEIVDASTGATPTFDMSLLAGDLIVNENAIEGTACIEINGLQSLVSDGTTQAGAGDIYDETLFKTIWQVDRTDFNYLKSSVHDAGGAPISEEMLMDRLMDMEFIQQADPNLLMCSPKAMLAYFNNEVAGGGAGGGGASAGSLTPFNTQSSGGYRRFNTNSAMEWVGGVTGMGIQLGHKQLMLTTIASCPSNQAFMLNTKDFRFAKMTDGYKWLTEGGILKQKEASDNKFATAVNYCQFVCLDPRKQLKITDIDES